MTAAIRITVLGDHNPEFSTHRELDAVLARLPADVDATWVASDAPAAAAVGRPDGPGATDGVWVAPGGPYRDNAAVLAAIGRARRAGVPLLGTCSGFQFSAMELGWRSPVCPSRATPRSIPAPRRPSSRRWHAASTAGGARSPAPPG